MDIYVWISFKIYYKINLSPDREPFLFGYFEGLLLKLQYKLFNQSWLEISSKQSSVRYTLSYTIKSLWHRLCYVNWAKLYTSKCF